MLGDWFYKTFWTVVAAVLVVVGQALEALPSSNAWTPTLVGIATLVLVKLREYVAARTGENDG